MPGNIEQADRPASAQGPATISPHHASYDMALTSVKNGSNIVDVSGKLDFEWADACDGWTVQQNLDMRFAYNEGDESVVKSTEASWEAKDGKSYRFNVHHTNNGRDTENFRGKVTMNAGGGKATYTLPEGKTIELSPDTLFPSAHTLQILQKAAGGEKYFTRHVFDGTDDEGSSDVSAFIGSPATHLDVAEKLSGAKDRALLDQPSWPVRLAFFKAKTTTGAPDYEMDMTLLANGVIQKMRIDYGDFIVTGTLRDIKALPASGC